MEIHLMLPDSPEQGDAIERLCMFAARRARTLKGHDALAEEVRLATPERLGKFLDAVIREEWSLDVAEYAPLVFDIEGVPSWLATELFRHRLILRDWSPEQRSKRAISGERIPVLNPFAREAEPELWEVMDKLILHSQAAMGYLHSAHVPPEKLRYAALEGTETALTLAGNARAMSHLYAMRGSVAIGADGKAAPEARELTDEMFRLAQGVYPNLFKSLIRS